MPRKSRKSELKLLEERRVESATFFDTFIEHYSEIRSTHAKNKHRHGSNPKVIVATETDFVADVDIQARRALTKGGDWSLYWLFVGKYGYVTETEGMSHHQIVGMMLTNRGIYRGVVPLSINNPEVVNEIKWAVGEELRKVFRKRNPLDALKAYRREKEIGVYE